MRDHLDRYYTPEWATQALVDYMGERLAGCVWDPCCGQDLGGRVIRKAPHVTAYAGTDIDPDACANPVDFFGRVFVFNGWVVTNPPYRVGDKTATDFVRHALNGSASVAMLLRLTWLEPCRDRVDILTNNPPTDVLILPRVHYIGAPASNNCMSCWVIWDRNHAGSRVSWAAKNTP